MIGLIWVSGGATPAWHRRMRVDVARPRAVHLKYWYRGPFLQYAAVQPRSLRGIMHTSCQGLAMNVGPLLLVLSASAWMSGLDGTFWASGPSPELSGHLRQTSGGRPYRKSAVHRANALSTIEGSLSNRRHCRLQLRLVGKAWQERLGKAWQGQLLRPSSPRREARAVGSYQRKVPGLR